MVHSLSPLLRPTFEDLPVRQITSKLRQGPVGRRFKPVVSLGHRGSLL